MTGETGLRRRMNMADPSQFRYRIPDKAQRAIDGMVVGLLLVLLASVVCLGLWWVLWWAMVAGVVVGASFAAAEYWDERR